MTVFDGIAEERFLDPLAELVSGLSKPHSPDSDIRTSCRDLVGAARGYRLLSEFEIAAYVLCGFATGIDFDTQTDLPFRGRKDALGEQLQSMGERAGNRSMEQRSAETPRPSARSRPASSDLYT